METAKCNILELTESIATWEGDWRVKVDTRGFNFLVDEPVELGGQDTGPMPTEVFLSSLASCICLSYVYVGKKMKINLPELEVKVRGYKDLSNFKFNKIEIETTSDIEEKLLKKITEKAIGYSFVTNTLMDGCTIEFK